MPQLDIENCDEYDLFAKADELYEKANHQQVIYNELKEVYDMDESMRMNVEVLWRLARSCHAVANTYDNKNPSKKVILHEGRDYATRAYNLDPNSFEVLRWVAALTGSLTDFLGTQEKIEQGYLFKEYLDKAIAMQPSEYTLLHMRGRFSFSVANLSWFERKAAAALYTAPPQATIDDALEDFLEVEELEPGSWIENLYYLIKCLLIKKNKTEAVKYMKIALEIEPIDDAQTQMLAEIRRLLSKHS